MSLRAVSISVLLLGLGSPLAVHSAMAASLPAIKASASNAVPACTTPDALMAFLRARNSDVDARFGEIAATYKRVGEELKLRWDIAFFQMMVETANLSFKRDGRIGDVLPAQNNFAGLGAPGRGEPGEAFASMERGVKAHLQHVLMYSGERIDAPVAERTRKVQEWGVLTAWHKSLKREVSFTDLTQKWSPNDQSYAATIGAITDKFKADVCDKPALKSATVSADVVAPSAVTAAAVGPAAATVASATPAVAAAGIANPNRQGGVSVDSSIAAMTSRPGSAGVELARQATERAKADGDGGRSALGARPAAKPAQPGPDQSLIDRPEAKMPGSNAKTVATVAVVMPQSPAPAAKAQCRVFTASYGGSKSVIIRQTADQYANYTVLDVNDDEEAREVSAFIDAYARNGLKIGEFRNQPEALQEAFKLCPEG